MLVLSIVPYWNWNCLILQKFQPSHTLNRTILELKWRTWMNNNLQLYSQSYHTGIEISLKLYRTYLANALNRTILELKLKTNQIAEIILRLSIVPYWNWNLYLDGRVKILNKLSIVPYWNWNRLLPLLYPVIMFLSIVPYWNWNFFKALPYLSCQCLSIVPYWNWNDWISSWLKSILVSQSYHTGIEMDLGVTFFYLRKLSIVPYWNWNGSNPKATSCSTASQSYHTGIEIRKLKRISSRNFPLNRTILELKWKR